ncbi:hypothetical protein ABW21_db0205292 [Orbilia brochopaga]|nr:hypothetical protein ABW21_db0205292 [Drechslerella brochopaga]
MAAHEVPAALDHVVVLLPYQELKDPPRWLTDNFTITDGGRHADGKTENKLIIFEDGSYIELISFIDDLPENRSGHWWGARSPSIVDWAFTTNQDYSTHQLRISSQLIGIQSKILNPSRDNGWFSYAVPKTGGRTRPDGTKLEWAVTFPTCTVNYGAEEIRPINLPFFCHDITPRERRVAGATDHPCAATGIRELRILVDESYLEAYSSYAGAVLNAKPEDLADGGKKLAVQTINGASTNVIFIPATTDPEKMQVHEHQFALKELVFNFKSGDRTNGITFSYPPAQ